MLTNNLVNRTFNVINAGILKMNTKWERFCNNERGDAINWIVIALAGVVLTVVVWKYAGTAIAAFGQKLLDKVNEIV